MKKYKILRAAVTQSKKNKAESVVNFKLLSVLILKP
jgi:hypothetical protein